MDLTNQYCYFYDDDKFNETDRAGFRRRVITGDLLQLCFWRIDGGATGSFLHHHVDNEQLGIIVRGKLDFRIGEPDDRNPRGARPGRGVPGAACGVARRQRVHRRRRVRRGAGSSTCSRPRERTCAMADRLTAPDWRLAVDIGGTFTDVVLIDAASGRVVVDKTLTTPAAPLDGVRTGVRQLLAKAGVRPADITAPIVHATTLITNALIEGKIGRAGVVTTTGFGDTMLIRDEHRYDMYDLQIEFPSAARAPRPRRSRSPSARNPIGEVVETPAAADLDARHRGSLRDAEVEAVGVCLINAYANPANERVVAEHLRRELGVPVCISAEISPQIREYPRMITTACNAATMPVIGPYLDELQKWLAAEGFGGSVLMMLSNGGVVSADDAARAPIRLVESGPAAGALAGSWFARRLGEDRLLCFDMGGTTAKSCLIVDGEPELTNTFEVARMYRFKKGSGFPVSVPSVDLVEIGAGGGSLARDRRARPAEGRPGVGRRRPRPGVLRPRRHRRGGHRCRLRARHARRRVLPRRRHAARPRCQRRRAAVDRRPGSGLPAGDTAAGIHEFVNQNMAAAARMHAVEQGEDLRGVTLLAFGGAGPIHACGVAELLDSPRVIFPVNASVLSAFGTLVSPVRIDLARSMVRSLDDDLARRARPAARRSARRRSPRAGRGRRARRPHPIPVRARRPLPRSGQRADHLGRRRRAMAGHRRRDRRAVRDATTAASTA